MQLHRDRERFEAAGVELVAIGNGSVEQAAAFVERAGVEGLRLLVVRSRAASEARVEGARQGGIKGHPAQLGGVLIVASDGSMPYAHLAENAADIPPNDELLAAARAASGA